MVTAHGGGTPPEELVVPADLLSSDATTVPVRFEFEARGERPMLPDDAYGVFVTTTVEFGWTRASILRVTDEHGHGQRSASWASKFSRAR